MEVTKVIHTAKADLTDLECRILKVSLERYLVQHSQLFVQDLKVDSLDLVEDTIRAMINKLEEAIQ